MITLNITGKGEVTVGQELLQHLGVGPGEKVEADTLPDGRIVIRAAEQDGDIAEFVGCLARRGEPKFTIEEVNRIASRGWARKK